MRLQTGKIVLKYIENFVRREREAVNRFRDFLSDVVRQSDMVLLSLCTVSTLYGMVLIASATHFRNTFKYVAIQGFGLLLGVLLYFLLSSIDVSEVGKKWKWLLAFNFGFILLLRTPFGLTRNGNRAWLGVNDIGERLGIAVLKNFPITVQPAEIVKITFIILLARQLALLQEKKDLTRFSNVIQPTAHVAFMFAFYYVISKDAGSGLVYLFVFVCMAFAGGFALRWIFLGLGGAVGGFLAAWNFNLLRGDWYDRIKVILDHSYQPEGKGWQQTRGMLALGSGKLTGQGLFNGTQTQSLYRSSLPERQTAVFVGLSLHTLFQQHVDYFSVSFFTCCIVFSFRFQTKNIEHEQMEHTLQFFQIFGADSRFLVNHRINHTGCIKQMRNNNRCIQIVVHSLVAFLTQAFRFDA